MINILDLNAVIETMLGRSEDGKYECLTCGKTFETKQGAKKHADVHLGLVHSCIVLYESLQNEERTRCSLYKVPSSSDRLTLDNVLNVSPRQFLFWHQKLIINILDINAVVETLVGRTGDGKYQCLKCGKCFDTKQRVRRHAEIHIDVSLPCIVCQKVFKTRNALSAHYTRKHTSEVVSPWTMK